MIVSTEQIVAVRTNRGIVIVKSKFVHGHSLTLIFSCGLSEESTLSVHSCTKETVLLMEVEGTAASTLDKV